MTKQITTTNLNEFLTGHYDRLIGFDQVLNRLTDISNLPTGSSYPPYDIVQAGDNDFGISLAVAGLNIKDIEITQHANELVVAGTPVNRTDGETTFLYQGIARRSFERKFVLADYISVVNAKLTDGILNIVLHREVPDELKPRTIDIKLD